MTARACVRGWLGLAALSALAVIAWAVSLMALGFAATYTILAVPRAPGAVLAADGMVLHVLSRLAAVLT